MGRSQSMGHLDHGIGSITSTPYDVKSKAFDDGGTITAVPTAADITIPDALHYYFEVDTSGGDVDISALSLGTFAGQSFIFRKKTTDPNRVIYDDTVITKKYDYMNRKGEVINLIYDGSTYRVQ